MEKQVIKYPTTFKDQHGEIHTKIENMFDEKVPLPLSLSLNGIRFHGSSFDDFQLVDVNNYEEKQLNRFTFNKVKIWKSNEYVLELCNCELSFEIPISLIDIPNNKIINTDLLVDLKLGKPASNGGIDYENATFRIELKTESFVSEGDVFEDPLIELKNQFKGKYHFKNCFGCLYSDYSPYGNGFFGDLLCLKKCKKEYLKASSKREWLELMKKNSIVVQETYCCQEFEKRVKNTGYRG